MLLEPHVSLVDDQDCRGGPTRHRECHAVRVCVAVSWSLEALILATCAASCHDVSSIASFADAAKPCEPVCLLRALQESLNLQCLNKAALPDAQKPSTGMQQLQAMQVGPIVEQVCCKHVGSGRDTARAGTR